MGKGREMSCCDVEKASGKFHTSDFGSMARQRRLVCFALFAALLPFVITRSYLFYNSSDAPSENMFFEGQLAPAALHDNPVREDAPHFTSVNSSNSNSSGTETNNDQTEPESRTEDSEPNFSDQIIRNSSTAGGDDDAKPSYLEMETLNLDENNLRSLNASANITSSDFKIETENAKNVSSSGYLEGSSGTPSVAVNSSSGHSGDLLKENFENNTKEAEASGEIVMGGTTGTSTAQNASNLLTSEGECNLEQGKWVPDSRLPMYNSSTCRYIQGHQNCHKNGRPDDGYLYWKWKPDQCELPRIDATAFLTAMRNRSMVFAGDSIARNQFQSLLCMLSQVEDPKNTYHSEDDKNNVYLFRSFNFTFSICWSPYLVRVEDKLTTWPDNTTETATHIYVDEPDEVWVKGAVGADILQISTGQWWYKRAVYYEKGKALGCHGWPVCNNEIGFDKPYNKALAGILKGSLTIPGFSGTVVYRSFGPEHFEDGDWDSGGRCPRTTPGGVPMTFLTEWMYGIQTKQFKNVTEEGGAVVKGRLKMLGITNLSQIRADGHPDVYRTKEDKKSDKKGNIIPNDCLHWCLPGPIDTWNDILVQSLRDLIFK